MASQRPISNHRPAGRPDQPTLFFAGFKRSVDVVGGVVGLIAFAPLLLMCMAWIALVDGRPVFYRQWRVGKDGWLFQIYKLRTMTRHAEANGQARFATEGDPRVIPGCRWMRRSHVDELPQMWNILTGAMSLVGPRPERPEIVESLRHFIPRIDRRLISRPGLTGLAQLRHGYTNDVAGARRKIAWDLRYLRSRSVWGEVRLVLQTFPKVWDEAAL